jgi:hypothetical protein
MPVRDWDKIRRQTRANKPELVYRPSRPRKPKKHRHILKFKPINPNQPNITKILRIERGSFLAFSLWSRTSGHWHCSKAAPSITWFTRVNHPSSIESWLRLEHYSFQWLPATPACVAHLQAEGLPAEAYPLSPASQPSGTNTDPSLNKHTQADHCESSNPASTGNSLMSPCLAQTGVNPSPRCLIQSQNLPGRYSLDQNG